MGKIIKFVVPFVVLGGVGYATTDGNPMGAVKKQVGKVKRMVTRMELNRFADRMLLDYESSGNMPPVESPDDFQQWVETNFKSRGTRNSSNDFWNNPYEVVVVDDGHMVLISRGPNGIPDDGCSGDFEPDLQDIMMEVAEAAEGDEGIPPELEGSVDPNDDVCVEVNLIRE